MLRTAVRRAAARDVSHVPSLPTFFQKNVAAAAVVSDPGAVVPPEKRRGHVFVESYGCQMNLSDTELVYSVMKDAGYEPTSSLAAANIVFLNTCAIRDKAEAKIWQRLRQLRSLRQATPGQQGFTVGVLGCMAERLKTKLLEKEDVVDIVAGPDAYRDLPRLIDLVSSGSKAVNTQLSLDETYADVRPLRVDSNRVSAFVSITRGCNHMCSYCIVPFTRGRERSRPFSSLLEEVKSVEQQGYKEVTLLGQNVNTYYDETTPSSDAVAVQPMAQGFKSIVRRPVGGMRFAELLLRLSEAAPEVRFRFTSPHPAHCPDELLHVIASRPNVASQIHMPAQSGSTRVLDLMRRGYTRESYLELVDRMRAIVPNVALSSDFISGFCGETEQDHEDTVSLLKLVRYDQAFMFAYSMREKTHAHRNYTDDVPAEVKQRRLAEVIDTFYSLAREKNEIEEVGRQHLVLVEGRSRRKDSDLSGRSDSNKRVIFPDVPLPGPDGGSVAAQPGDYVVVRVDSASPTTLRSTGIARSSIAEAVRDGVLC